MAGRRRTTSSLLRGPFGQRASAPAEPLGVLLLPCRVEEFELADHARDLLSIPRVVAVEPARRRTPRLLRDAVPARQAKRLRFPGYPRVVVLYHPVQYPLARSLVARYSESELWYIGRDAAQIGDEAGYTHDELAELDQLARARARQTISPGDGALHFRLRELEIISPRPFVPGARIQAR
jgi:hypothetical protein